MKTDMSESLVHAGATLEADLVSQESVRPAVAQPELCPCGAPVDPDLIELRTMLPSLPSLCTACYEVSHREDEARDRRDRENAEHRRRLALLDATVPPEILATDLSHPTFNKALFVAAQGWQPDSGKWLFISGPPGKCKTRVVGLLVKRLILDGHRVTWATAGELQAAVEALNAYGKSEAAHRAAEMAKLRAWRTAGILVLDDLGKNTWFPTLESKLFDLIDHRKTNYLPTIITANSPLKDLLREMLQASGNNAARSGPIIGRIIEASKGWTLSAA